MNKLEPLALRLGKRIEKGELAMHQETNALVVANAMEIEAVSGGSKPDPWPGRQQMWLDLPVFGPSPDPWHLAAQIGVFDAVVFGPGPQPWHVDTQIGLLDMVALNPQS
jgi:hypothetical protein